MAHYTADTLRRYTGKARERLTYYLDMPAEEFAQVHVHLSTGNEKIGATVNVSLLPIITCGNCGNCCGHCYDIKACLRFPAALEARAINTAIMMRDRARYFREIWEAMRSKRRPGCFRFHVGGEIPDVEYLAMMAETARLFPDWKVWSYTHMHSTAFDYIFAGGSFPENFHLMLSVDDGGAIFNPYGLPTFECIPVGAPVPAGRLLCPGDCQKCLRNGLGCPAGQSAVVYEH